MSYEPTDRDDEIEQGIYDMQQLAIRLEAGGLAVWAQYAYETIKDLKSYRSPEYVEFLKQQGFAL